MNKKVQKLIGILAVVLAANILFRWFGSYFFDNALSFKIVYKSILSIVLCVIIYKYGFKIYRYQSPSIRIVLFLSLLMFCYLVYQVYSFTKGSGIENYSAVHIKFLASCFSVAIFEELTFRCFFYKYLRYKLHKSLRFSILFTALIFGLVHLSNIGSSDYEPWSILNQVFFAVSFGILLQSIYVRTKSMFLIVLIHACSNYLGTYKMHLLPELESVAENYTFTDFTTTFLSILMITVVLILPVSYFLVKNELSHSK